MESLFSLKDLDLLCSSVMMVGDVVHKASYMDDSKKDSELEDLGSPPDDQLDDGGKKMK